jgi:peptidoglycan hydrolase-like protein with peptidoglycan-binding domain
MMTSKVYRLLMGMLRLALWPGVIAAYGDWRIGQAQERLKAAGFDRGYIDGVLGSRTRNALRLTKPPRDYQSQDSSTRPLAKSCWLEIGRVQVAQPNRNHG